MGNSMIPKTILFLSGLVASGIGAAILLLPVEFYAANGMELGGSVSALNEARASGGALMASGALIMIGAFVARLFFTSAVLATLLYLAYGLSRVLSMAVDGMPTDGLLQATVFEIAVGLVCAVVLFRYRERA
ncbi:MAG: DUF4345 domain-containing protein [Inquilinus sp.]|nr:DUF4345 domain-containing protein [Inquilinus sp.]